MEAKIVFAGRYNKVKCKNFRDTVNAVNSYHSFLLIVDQYADIPCEAYKAKVGTLKSYSNYFKLQLSTGKYACMQHNAFSKCFIAEELYNANLLN